MKATILQETLARSLSIVGRAVKASTTLPVLSNILICTDNGRLRFAGTDLEIGIQCWADVKSIEGEWAITVPAKTISDLVSTLTKEDVNLAVDLATQTLLVKCGKSKTEIKGISAAEFPAMPRITKPGITMPAANLKEAILKVVPATGEDEARPTLTGVHVKMATGKMTLEAADGFRMSQATLSIDPTASGSAIVPARAMEELAKALTDGSVTISTDNNRANFKLGSVEITTQLIEGAYPDLAQIVPKSFKTTTTVATAALQKAVKQGEIFARSGRMIVTLNITPTNGVPGSIKVTGESDETRRIETVVEATAAGNPLVIAFNPQFLGDALKTVKSTNVVLETNLGTTPGVLRPENDLSYFHLLMPMHLG